MVQAQDRIDAKLKQQSIKTEQVTSNRVRRLIKQLKLNASPAQDGISAKHSIYALGSQSIGDLSYMLTLCIQFGVVPHNFRQGVLISIPKKAGCDTTETKNWRPITVSSIFSKLLELSWKNALVMTLVTFNYNLSRVGELRWPLLCSMT